MQSSHSDNQDTTQSESIRRVSQRSMWKIGEKLPISYSPSVEGMVVSSRWRDGVFMVIFLVPQHEKLGGTAAAATLIYRAATSVAKKPLVSYDYPFPSDPQITQEVIKANGNLDLLQDLINYLNKPAATEKPLWESTHTSSPLPEQPLDMPIASHSSSATSTEMPFSSSSTTAPNATSSSTSCHQDTSLSFSSSATASFPLDSASPFLSEEVLNTLTHELSRRLRLSHNSLSHFSTHCPSIVQNENPYPESSPRRHLSSRKKRENPLTSSSSSESASSSSDSDVGLKKTKKGSGWFSCPFSTADDRQVTLPKKAMKGKHEERRMLRKALHNLYSEFSTLKWYVDSLKPDSLNSSFRPFSNDLVSLSLHAVYLDQLLLHATNGPWTTWNDLVLDHLTRSFLEFLVRASPTRSYPELLDEKVRRWMKRKRIGLSTQYGPVPNYLVDAKITDSGIHPKNGWTSFSKKDSRPSINPPTSSFRPRPPPFPPSDKKSSA